MSIELISYFGNDLMVSNTAKVSYGKESKELGDKEIKLINYLASHNHWSPFSHPKLQFRLTIPIYVERQLV